MTPKYHLGNSIVNFNLDIIKSQLIKLLNIYLNVFHCKKCKHILSRQLQKKYLIKYSSKIKRDVFFPAHLKHVIEANAFGLTSFPHRIASCAALNINITYTQENI